MMNSSLLICLQINSLDALDPNAYAAFQASHDLRDVVDRVLGRGGASGGDGATPTLKKGLSIRASLMTPVKPMLVGQFHLTYLNQTLLASSTCICNY